MCAVAPLSHPTSLPRSQAHADVTATDSRGRTAVEIAAESGAPLTVVALLFGLWCGQMEEVPGAARSESEQPVSHATYTRVKKALRATLPRETWNELHGYLAARLFAVNINAVYGGGLGDENGNDRGKTARTGLHCETADAGTAFEWGCKAVVSRLSEQLAREKRERKIAKMRARAAAKARSESALRAANLAKLATQPGGGLRRVGDGTEGGDGAEEHETTCESDTHSSSSREIHPRAQGDAGGLGGLLKRWTAPSAARPGQGDEQALLVRPGPLSC